jgi:sporulation protein YlmC with PRC-barrel domain
MRLELGTHVRCTDGAYGELADIVVDPVRNRVTHLVVRPAEHDDESRLVPVELASAGAEQREIELKCTLGDAAGFEEVHEAAFLRLGESPAVDPGWDIGVDEYLAFPYYAGIDVGPYPSDVDPNVTLSYDRVPKGEVEVRRASAVISSDGHSLGEVDGFVIDDDDLITHFVLERGHLWGRREVTIPIGAVARVESDVVHVALSKDEVGDLPSVRVHRGAAEA